MSTIELCGQGASGLSLPFMKLYNYFRSSASFRVRVALQLKGLPYDYIPVHLGKGEHRQPGYAAVSPDLLVPTLVTFLELSRQRS